MNVLSLFDGISCGQVALERAGIKVDNYYASEIDKFAIKVCQKNYPNTKQLGDIIQLTEQDIQALPKINLVIGGSPCQSLSSANTWLNEGEKGVNGTGKSNLFWEFVRVLNLIKERKGITLMCIFYLRMQAVLQRRIQKLYRLLQVLLVFPLILCFYRHRIEIESTGLI